MYKRIDIHAHVNFAAFAADRDEVIARTLKSGTAMINVGSQYETSKLAVELAEKYESGVYAIVGLHPIHSGTAPIADAVAPPLLAGGALPRSSLRS
ncbi:MAG: TatD family hydrolase, partial [Patescibacteria group bacterium]